MKGLMIGTLVPDVMARHCFEKEIRVSAADIAQRYMVHGLQTLNEIERIDVVGAVRVKPWPTTKVLRFVCCEQAIEKGSIRGCGYYNLPFLGFWLRELSIVSAVKKWAMLQENRDDIFVLVYAMSSSGMKAASVVKKIIPAARIVLCVPDIPLLMKPGGKLRNFAKQIDWFRINRLRKFIDKYLLYTKYMAEYLKLEQGRWQLFEGLIDEIRIVDKPEKKTEPPICLYAGNLDSRYGIDSLIEAFTYLKRKATLQIYGAGTAEEQNRIRLLVKDKPGIEYKGHVTQDEIFQIMKTSTLLMNPRPTNLKLSKYSCPSKTFEYMASGTPVLMNKLEGLPEEYWNFVVFFDGETPLQYAKKIDEMLSKSKEELSEFGKKAADFLRKEKNSSYVMKTVLEFITK